MFRERVKSRIAGLDVQRLFLSGTHTHTAPVTSDKNYAIPKDIMQPVEYREFFCDRVSETVVRRHGRAVSGVE